MAIERTAVRAGSWAARPGALGAFAPCTAWSHNRVRPLMWAVRDTEQNTEGISGTLSAGVTGENSPHYTNQPTKMKTDRVLVKYFLRRTQSVGNTHMRSNHGCSEASDSMGEEIQLFWRAGS
jgi:hypothetical protein